MLSHHEPATERFVDAPLGTACLTETVVCRMRPNRLAVGMTPLQAFELMQGEGELDCVALTHPCARCRIDRVALDCPTLPVTARLLVEPFTRSSTAPRAAAE